MRTLVATLMPNAKGKKVFCFANKISEELMRKIKYTDWDQLSALGFTFISLVSPDYPNIRGHAIFFEGHLDEIGRALKNI